MKVPMLFGAGRGIRRAHGRALPFAEPVCARTPKSSADPDRCGWRPGEPRPRRPAREFGEAAKVRGSPAFSDRKVLRGTAARSAASRPGVFAG